MKTDFTSIGERIYAGMLNSCITSVSDLARRAGVSRSVAKEWLYSSTVTVDASTLFQIADAVGLSARWILTGTGCPTARIQVTPNEHRLVSIYSKLPKHAKHILLHCAVNLEQTA